MNHDPGSEPKVSNTQKLNWIGGGVTIAWLSAVIWYSFARSSGLASLEPNEIGDFLAGVFAPLAFFWLVLGFFQQGIELRNSGRALWLQGEELRNSVEQQRDLVQVTREQLTFEGNRLAQEIGERRRRSQPNIVIDLGGSTQSGREISQNFWMINHGRPCTGVVVNFNGRRPEVKIDLLATGARKEFRIDSQFDVSESVSVGVNYIDEAMQPGSAVFVIEGRPPNFTISKVSTETE